MSHILLIDDEEDMLAMTGRWLEKAGHAVTKASSGKNALEKILAEKPDLILLDVIMPQMNGLETLKRLRKNADNSSEIPVIFLTGDDEFQTELEGLHLGAVDFIHKPVNPEILALRVSRMIEFERLKKDLGKEVEKKTRENNSLTLHVVQTLAEAIDAKDTYTNGHSGRGYPDGLKGDEIPEQARIIAVDDAYDAMTSNRSYRDLMPQEKVRSEIEKGKGAQFDEKFADIMISMIDEDTEYTMHEGTEKEEDLRERSSEEAIQHMGGEKTLPEELLELKQLNSDLGIYMCGDVEDYLEALSIFADSIAQKSEKIEKAWKNEEIAEYTTLVHSLKSSARTVGAVELSDLAKKLEAVGKHDDIAYIRDGTELLLNKYRELEAPLKKIAEV